MSRWSVEIVPPAALRAAFDRGGTTCVVDAKFSVPCSRPGGGWLWRYHGVTALLFQGDSV
jgi:hypothetical protein